MAFVVRFVAFGILFGVANFVPYVRTRGDYGNDGFEVAGWPWRFYEMGGLDGHCYFRPGAIAGNFVVAVAGSAIAAWCSHGGVLRTLGKWGERPTPNDGAAGVPPHPFRFTMNSTHTGT